MPSLPSEPSDTGSELSHSPAWAFQGLTTPYTYNDVKTDTLPRQQAELALSTNPKVWDQNMISNSHGKNETKFQYHYPALPSMVMLFIPNTKLLSWKAEISYKIPDVSTLFIFKTSQSVCEWTYLIDVT